MCALDIPYDTHSQLVPLAALVSILKDIDIPVAPEQLFPLRALFPDLDAGYAHCGNTAVVIKRKCVYLAFADAYEAQLVRPVHRQRIVKARVVRPDVLGMPLSLAVPDVIAGFRAVVRLPELEAYHASELSQVRKADHPGVATVLGICADFPDPVPRYRGVVYPPTVQVGANARTHSRLVLARQRIQVAPE